jgi:mannose-1-phosphate guanylyltransferase/phosphomannomutase
MLKRALISGIPSTGINVRDLGTVPTPVLRHCVRLHDDIAAGIHVRLSPFDQRVVDIRIIDKNGMNQSKNAERAVERAYFREDFRRAFLDEIGMIEYDDKPIESYIENFLASIDVEAIRAAHFRIVIDYSHGLAAETFAQILNQLGVEVVPLNARMEETKLAMLQYEFRANLERTAKIVSVLDADLGLQLDVAGEKLFVVDEKGNILDDITAAALMVELAMQNHPGSTILAPITLPNSISTIVGWRNGHALRSSNNLQSIMESANTPDILMGVDGNGNFIFPAFQPAVDGMMAAAKLLEYLAHYRTDPSHSQHHLSEIVDYLPKFFLAEARAHCATGSKGAIMRLLNEQYGPRDGDYGEGIKITLSNCEWVHITPDPDYPYFTIVAEGSSTQRAGELVDEYRLQIEQLLPAPEATPLT